MESVYFSQIGISFVFKIQHLLKICASPFKRTVLQK